MKPFRRPDPGAAGTPRGAAVPRRAALVLLAGGGALGWLAWPAPALGYGPLRLGMGRAAALRALGPGALPAPLCAGVEGVMFDWPDAALCPHPVPAMAMFGAAGGGVSEMQASLSHPDGGFTAEAWRALVAGQAAELGRRCGTAPLAGPEEADMLGAARQWRFRHRSGEVTLAARWMRRSGASFSRLHWLAAGVPAVIEG
jgi:hypothetical protein